MGRLYALLQLVRARFGAAWILQDRGENEVVRGESGLRISKLFLVVLAWARELLARRERETETVDATTKHVDGVANACARHFDGDFAFVLVDRRARTVVCARDPFGVKPLVYTQLPGTLFACASEACALLAKVKQLKRRLDRAETWDVYIAGLRQRHNSLRALKEEMAAAKL